MKKITLSALFFIVSLSANAAPTLTWDSYTGSFGANAAGSGSHLLTGADLVTSGAFSHDWNFSSDEDADISVGAFALKFLTDVMVSLDGVELNITSVSNLGFGASTTNWYETLGVLAGQHTLNVVGIVSAPFPLSLAASSSYTFHIDAADYSANNVTATPLPAAAWLFISAILGVGGLASRRKTLPVDGLAA